MAIITDKSTIINFLCGTGEDHLGRTYQETLVWSDAHLELCHDQVQWIFPLFEKSNHAATYPIINKNIVEEAKKNPQILENLRLAKIRFEKFLAIGKYADIDKQRKWMREGNHNLLRVTRIIRCLRLFGLDEEATDFYKNILVAASRFGIGKNTYTYWEMAYNDNVWDTMQI